MIRQFNTSEHQAAKRGVKFMFDPESPLAVDFESLYRWSAALPGEAAVTWPPWSSGRRESSCSARHNACAGVSSACGCRWSCARSGRTGTASLPCECVRVAAGCSSDWSSWSTRCISRASLRCVYASGVEGQPTGRSPCRTSCTQRLARGLVGASEAFSVLWMTSGNVNIYTALRCAVLHSWSPGSWSDPAELCCGALVSLAPLGSRHYGCRCLDWPCSERIQCCTNESLKEGQCLVMILEFASLLLQASLGAILRQATIFLERCSHSRSPRLPKLDSPCTCHQSGFSPQDLGLFCKLVPRLVSSSQLNLHLAPGSGSLLEILLVLPGLSPTPAAHMERFPLRQIWRTCGLGLENKKAK